MSLRFPHLRRWGYALVLMPLLLLAGCANQLTFKVDALRDAEFSPAGRLTYRLVPPAEAGLRWEETAHYAQIVVDAAGYVKAFESEQPAILIFASAEVSAPLTDNVRRSEPIYVRTNGFYRTIRSPVYRDGKISGYAYDRVYVPPQTEFGGWVDYKETVTVYEKRLTLIARRNNGTATGGEELWTLTVATIDPSTDLRRYLPYLAAAALPYVGEQTDGEVVVKLAENDPSVSTLRSF